MLVPLFVSPADDQSWCGEKSTFIHVLARVGMVDVLSRLLTSMDKKEIEASTNSPDAKCQTPLSLATESRQIYVVK